MEYQMNLKPFDRVENLACQCEKIIEMYGLQQIVETKAGKKKWRQVIISKIKAKLFSDRIGESLDKFLDTEIREDYVKFFDWLNEHVVSNASEHKRDLNFQSPPRPSGSSKQTKGFNEKGKKQGKKQGHKRA